MQKESNYKQYFKTLFVVIVFTLLTISIVKNATELHAVSSMQQPICVPIMMYHQVKGNYFSKDVISPYEFESDLKYLKENNYNTITMTQLIDYVYEGKELPQNPIILSFDDGYLSTYKNVFPLLQKYDMKIVLSIIGKVTDDFSKVVDNNINYAHSSWNQIKEMNDSGLVEIQNHTYNLHKVCDGRYGCGQMANETISNYEKLMIEDVIILQEKIKLVTEKVPNTFTYPFGKYNDNTDTIIKKLGFKATLSVKFGVNMISREKPEKLFGLKRICRAHKQSIGKLIKDGMATLKYSKD
ncbi:MAG: polysaccharide deacetylase [Herbinix sp.]|jgi:peptidoglycan/xylan/chitin deacetylase (PgdA/CDA1 family)|nr:polysaccharide deacetylase [Herbinix sp.]